MDNGADVLAIDRNYCAPLDLTGNEFFYDDVQYHIKTHSYQFFIHHENTSQRLINDPTPKVIYHLGYKPFQEVENLDIDENLLESKYMDNSIEGTQVYYCCFRTNLETF